MKNRHAKIIENPLQAIGVAKELQQLEWIVETLKYDLKVCERVIKNYKKNVGRSTF
ncbi:hypothetical protein LCGC14_2031410 [marine sediment metagenome]|uniref:Uncharacterized protein n=1 Tax=marine sediment metagenome TaxID=412755 RepID=A0A0F9EUU5_9ZZZZ